MMKEVALLGSFCYGGGDREPEFATAAASPAAGATSWPPSPRTSSPLDDVADGLRAPPTTRRTGAIKVTLTP